MPRTPRRGSLVLWLTALLAALAIVPTCSQAESDVELYTTTTTAPVEPMAGQPFVLTVSSAPQLPALGPGQTVAYSIGLNGDSSCKTPLDANDSVTLTLPAGQTSIVACATISGDGAAVQGTYSCGHTIRVSAPASYSVNATRVAEPTFAVSGADVLVHWSTPVIAQYTAHLTDAAATHSRPNPTRHLPASTACTSHPRPPACCPLTRRSGKSGSR